MKRKSISLLSIILVFGLLLANILYEKTPVQAAGDSSVAENDTYKWYQAKSLTDLKQCTETVQGKTETWSYEGTWIPIIIVAEYPDGTQYYMNRDTATVTFHSGESSLIPRLNSLNTSDSVGKVLLNAMREGGEFYTRGDLHAMHMFYHGECTSKYPDGSITAEAWSLTKDSNIENAAFGEKITTRPSTVYGIREHSTYVTTDQNEVKSWDGGLPTTYSPRDSSDTFRQGWSFIPYKNDTFLISNMFSWKLGDKLYHWAGNNAYALTMGCVLGGTSRYADPDSNKRNYIETPSRAAATIYDSGSQGNTLRGEKARKAIIEQYEYKYDKQKTRVSFKIFVGQKLSGSQQMAEGDSTLTGTKVVGIGNELSDGATLTVQKNAVLIVPADSFFYLNGFIKNYGTIIVGEDSTVTSTASRSSPTTLRGISCMDGGTLIIEKNAKVYLETLMLDGGTVVNNGNILIQERLSMKNAQMQIDGSLTCGVLLNAPATLPLIDTNKSFSSWFWSDGTFSKKGSELQVEFQDDVSCITIQSKASIVAYQKLIKTALASHLKSQDFTGAEKTIQIEPRVRDGRLHRNNPTGTMYWLSFNVEN